MLLEEKESNQFKILENLKFSYWVYNLLIPITLIGFFYCSYLSYRSIREHKVMVQYEPVRDGIMHEKFDLERRKLELSRILKIRPESPEALIELSLIFERVDSINGSNEYKNDSTSFAQAKLSFTKVENKLSIKFLFELFGAILFGFAFFILAKAFYMLDDQFEY